MVGRQSKSVAMRPNNPIDRDLLGNTRNARYYTSEMTFCKTAIRPSNYIVGSLSRVQSSNLWEGIGKSGFKSGSATVRY